MKSTHLSILILASLLLAACGSSQSAIATAIAETQQISDLQTQVAQSLQPPTSTPTQEAAAPSATAGVLATATPSTPYVSVSVDTHCRSGPRVDYKLLTTILVGEQVQVIAEFPGSDYVVVMRPGGAGSCWLWLRYADRTDFSGYDLPRATQPPTSTPTYTPSPTYTPTITYTPSATYTPSPTP
jgi:uncharacterized protein YgiM (DUF1202 family)